jgi:hypothetical protein
MLAHFPALLASALAGGIYDPQIELGFGDALVSCEAEPLRRLSVVLRHALAFCSISPQNRC